MVSKKLDNRIKVLIENGVLLKHRSLFLMVGDRAKDQAVILHHILSKASIKARPTVLWCYKKDLGFSSHRKKRMKQIQKAMKSGKQADEEDPFESFVASTHIRYCYYNESHKIIGNTFGMCILQDFEAVTPNLLARTIETVEGGGLVLILLQTMTSLRQLYTLAMDAHSRYRTESHQDVTARFNERFLLSLTGCDSCIFLDDKLNLLPVSSASLNIEPVPSSVRGSRSKNDEELATLVESLQDAQPVGSLVKMCKTLDQANSVLKFLDIITEKTLNSTVSLTAARGRGKSAALGISVAGAIAFMYSNIFVTSPSPENLKTFFEFVLKGFDALEYEEHTDYEVIQSTNPEFNKAVIRINVFREHRQVVQYIHPKDNHKLGQCELLIVDEAAAIPLPVVKDLFGPYLVFLSSTINGYEGTGRSLSLKLIQQLRQQSSTGFTGKKESIGVGRTLHELTLSESIRYSPGDPIESWLNQLLCLNATDNVPRLAKGCPPVDATELYYVSRDTLFSFHPDAEDFLQRMVAIYVSAHYKNSPNDLQMMSDAPAHHLFCLFGPITDESYRNLDILCVVQVCLEGEISKESVTNSLARGKRAAGDLIPWTIAQQFQDDHFPKMSGVRIVRIATHPDYQNMGYGSRAIQLLRKYYQGLLVNPDEDFEEMDVDTGLNTVDDESVSLLTEQSIGVRKNLPPLFVKLGRRRPEKIDYVGVSYGLTQPLLKFWKRHHFVTVYLRQTQNDLTGEHSCIMLSLVDEAQGPTWLKEFFKDFRCRLVNLLGYQFSAFTPSLALSLLQQKEFEEQTKTLTRTELPLFLSDHDLQRLDLYSRNLVDHHLITDLLPTVARLHFLRRADVHLSVAQSAILLALGLQHKTIDDVVKALDLPANQVLALFNRAMRKFVQHFNGICEKAIEDSTGLKDKTVISEPARSLDEDLAEAAQEIEDRQAKDKELLKQAMDTSKYAIRGEERDWEDALKGGPKGSVSIKKKSKKRVIFNPEEEELKRMKQKKKKKQKSS